MMNGFGGHGWSMGFGMGWWWIIGIILVILIIWVVVRNTNQTNARNSSDNQSAMDILKNRYARGEISKEEYEERKKELNK